MSTRQLTIRDNTGRPHQPKTLSLYQDGRAKPLAKQVVGEDTAELQLHKSAAADRRETDLLAEVSTAQMQAAAHATYAGASASAAIGEGRGAIG